MPKSKASKNKGPKISYYEIITTFKISNAEKELIDLNLEIEKLAEVNDTLKKKNRSLTEKRDNNMRKAMEEYKNFTNKLNAKKTLDKDEVINEMKLLWEFRKNEEKETLNIRKEIKLTEREITNMRHEYKTWEDFKNVGTHELSKEIQLLRKELADMNENYEIISISLKKNLSEYIDSIHKSTRETIEKKNKHVADKAFKDIDKGSIEMSRENEWMRKQIEMYKKEIDEVKEMISDSEHENVQLISYLFECNNDELKIIRDVFQTQFLENDNLDQNSIMNFDLEEFESVRPNSSLDFTIRKIKEIELKNSARESNKQLAIMDSQHKVKLNRLDNNNKQLTSRSSLIEKSSIVRPLSAVTSEGDLEDNQWPITQEMLNRVLFSENLENPITE